MSETIKKLVEIPKELDDKLKNAVTNESIIQGRTVTEQELLFEYIEKGINTKKTLKK